MDFKIPKLINNENGEIRKAGFEFEFTGIDLHESAKIVKKIFGGKIKEKSKFEFVVEGARFGDFNIEIDADILLNKGYEKYLKKAGLNLNNYTTKPSIEDILGKIASTIVPYEIITPPIAFDNFDIINHFSRQLSKGGAKGTKSSILNAFGMHINSEIPSYNSRILVSYLKSFFLLYDYIYDKSEIDLTRKLTPFIDNFQSDYIDLILKPDYFPDIDEFIDQYLIYNPTRNRPLDMLPVFTMIDEEKVKKSVKDFKLVGKRPAFHYRLPNCNIADKEWSPSKEWNLWYEIEHLASNKDKIMDMSYDYLKIKNRLIWKQEWIKRCGEYLND